MTLHHLSQRLDKIEARKGTDTAFFVIWGRTEDEITTEVAERLKVRPGDNPVGLIWPDPTPDPTSRVIALGSDDCEVSDRELKLMIAAFESENIRREREESADRGEDLSHLDDTDIRIRILRRTSKNLVHDLRWECIRANPDPEYHFPPCHCPTCQSGETTFLAAHDRHHAQWKAWLARYVPGEELFI